MADSAGKLTKEIIMGILELLAEIFRIAFTIFAWFYAHQALSEGKSFEIIVLMFFLFVFHDIKELKKQQTKVTGYENR